MTQPSKKQYFVGQPVQLDGIAVRALMQSGRTFDIDPAQLSVAPATLTAGGTQTVTVGYENVSASFSVTVDAVKPVRALIASDPAEKAFTYKTSPDFSGLSVRIIYNDGHEELEKDLTKMKIEPESSARVRRGSQSFRVTTHGVSATFTMQARLVWWQWLILILLFGWIWY